MREALTSYLGLGCRLGQTQILSRLAEGLLARGATEDGLQVIGEALAAARETGERYWEAELHRLHGELIAAARADRAGDAGSEAEDSFQTALALARRQEARSLELRAALSLSRRSAGAADRETRQILQAIYASFTEGFGVDDLQQARLELGKEEVP
jgi:predicted ATPase